MQQPVRHDWSFVRRPRWILSHLFVLSAVVAMVNLGLWQLDRLDQRRAANAVTEARIEQPASGMSELLTNGPAAMPEEVAEIEFRTVRLSGTYSPEDEVLVSNRTMGGSPGFWVLTPLVQPDGTAVVVNRGWVPFATTDPTGSFEAFAPPTGPVEVLGMVRASQVRETGVAAGPLDPTEGRLRTLARADIGRLQAQVQHPLYPLFVDLRSQDPAPGTLPIPVPAPDLGEGPHLDYAGQWFIFATLTAVVYPLLLRRVARQRAIEAAARADEAPLEPPDPTLEPVAGGRSRA